MSDFSDLVGNVSTVFRNVLRLRAPTLRITIRLGDLDAVFDPVGTVLGKKQRLQALGYYYEVITGPAAGNNVTEAFTNCLAAWRRKREATLGAPFANDAAVEADMQAQIRVFVLEGGALPAVGGEVRVLLPGALTFNNNADLGAGGNADGTALPSLRFNDEGTMWANNLPLGKIPIIALVEKDTGGGVWIPAPNELVHFRLIPPFHDDAANELADVNALRNQSEQANGPPPGTPSAPVAGVGPRPFITNATGAGGSFVAADPQRYNAHTSRGGKRGLPVLNNIFDPLPAPAFPNMNAIQASRHTHAVQARTNANGEAGILLKPNRAGGDRYRLRIFVDPVALRASDGTEANAVSQQTGRFCVWKHILWSRCLIKPLPNLPPQNSVLGDQARLAILGYDTGPLDGIRGGRTIAATRAFQRNHPPLAQDGIAGANTRPVLDQAVTTYMNNAGAPLGVMNFGTVQAQFRQMYCFLVDLDAQAMLGTPMTAAFYQAAIRWARGQAHANQAAYGLSQVYNLNTMIEDVFDTPQLFSLRHPLQYNRTRGAGVPAAVAGAPANFLNYWQDASRVIYATGGLLELFLRFVTGNASDTNPPTANITRYSTPGLTLVQALSASQLMFPPNEALQVQLPPSNNLTGASGFAKPERACAIFYGSTQYVNWPYLGDGFTKNSMHEMGHTLYLRHHRTQPGGLHASASFREDHDNTDRCLMGYLFCEGEYCGKCYLKIRGWDISQMPV